MPITAKKFVFSVFALAALAACQPKEEAAPKAPEAPASTAPSTEVAPAKKAAVPGQINGTDMRKEDIGGDFEMTDGDGKPFKLSDLKGNVVVLSFGYTHCPDVCPTELLTYSDTLKQLGDDAKNVKVVFASVDPERDTPELIGKYAKQFHPDFIGITATEGQALPVIKQQYRVVSAKVNQKEGSANYLVDHTSGAYLIDKEGEVAIFSPYGTEPDAVAADIRTLL
ncbi:SCO family protein [Neisseria sp. N95_16]|uniref:Redoxin domain-containing protein n=1 Tax=Neisseria brasiliensis TaxID=2666100 RepID=A0A5Q3S0D3_9NEIS|nr:MULTISPECIES: SCO family protein [Neisseria]MRN37459.1 redoxin domain-containing protein [Neisseria brasiliensis]PJO09260.1 SCO family protein [Neisseria sp. N95_16]PJO77449.1 SCO family protein [Neisseria sp. N177_16]QGL24454.1 redoxin domain-containing protein [Neisseria brasiliensis]